MYLCCNHKTFKGYQLFCRLNGLADGQYKNFKYYMEVKNEY